MLVCNYKDTCRNKSCEHYCPHNEANNCELNICTFSNHELVKCVSVLKYERKKKLYNILLNGSSL